MAEPPGLDHLLRDLRAAGLRVGFTETARLREVFAQGPDLAEAPRLKSLLRALLVKNREQRAVFDRVFDAWLEQAQQAHRLLLAPQPKAARLRLSDESEPDWWQRLAAALRRHRPALVAAVAVLLVAVAVWFRPQGKSLVDPQPGETQTTVELPEVLPAADLRQRPFQSWMPELTVQPATPRWTGWPY
ncbi:MAG: hypothetical protein R3310_01035, partial [Candidatus Competibacteraceae bacterium]|nr:hypothetical protein [Candidatus Competibacteraceae bacterium]